MALEVACCEAGLGEEWTAGDVEQVGSRPAVGRRVGAVAVLVRVAVMVLVVLVAMVLV